LHTLADVLWPLVFCKGPQNICILVASQYLEFLKVDENTQWTPGGEQSADSGLFFAETPHLLLLGEGDSAETA